MLKINGIVKTPSHSLIYSKGDQHVQLLCFGTPDPFCKF